MQTAVAEAAGAQQASGDAGQPPQASSAPRLAAVSQRLDADAASIQPQLRSVQAGSLLQTLTARGASLDAMRATLTELGTAERSAFSAERAVIEQRMWTVIGALAVVWVLGLLVLARVPQVPAAPAVPATTLSLQPMMMPATEDARAAATDAESSPPTVDLAAAADLCTAIARITSAAALPDVLARSAAVLDASGIVLWMGAGQELFAAGSYGYDPTVISRLGPISRAADNATAAAWRTGEIRTVAGDMVSHGAVVAPMLGPTTCIGVLAAEIRHGREDDAATRAVTAMIAAQLAAVIAAWPGTSDTTDDADVVNSSR